MGFMVLDPNNDRGQEIDGVSEKGQEYQTVRIFGKDSTAPAVRVLPFDSTIHTHTRTIEISLMQPITGEPVR